MSSSVSSRDDVAPVPGAIDPDYPIDPVPPHARRSLFSLSIVLLGFTFFTPTMLAGAQRVYPVRSSTVRAMGTMLGLATQRSCPMHLLAR